MKQNILKLFTFLMIIINSFALVSCGVKGSPVAPAENPPIGLGKPSESPRKDDKKNTQKR